MVPKHSLGLGLASDVLPVLFRMFLNFFPAEDHHEGGVRTSSAETDTGANGFKEQQQSC